MKTASRIGLLMILIGVLSAPAATAQVFRSDNSTWTITEPTEVSGTILQPGTYMVSIVPDTPDRTIVRFTNPDKSKTFATVLTVPHAVEPDEEIPSTTWVYFPTIEGQPRALRSWFPSDAPRGIGYDFVYDEDRAAALARASKSRVVYYPEAVDVDLETTELQIVTPEARVETYVFPETPRVTVQTPRPAMVTETRTMLPATGGNTPLFALAGLLAVFAAFAIRIANR